MPHKQELEESNMAGPEEAKAAHESATAERDKKVKVRTDKANKDLADLQGDFLGENPTYYVTFDDYGNTRILTTLIGGKVQQRFLVIDANGRDYDFATKDQIVKQVRTYFKNNKEGLRNTLYNLGYMTEREYTTRSESALTSSILKVANEYTIDVVDSIRIDGKTKGLPTFTKWLSGIPSAGEGGENLPTRDINLMDRDVVEALVKDVYSRTTDMAIDDEFLKQETDRYMKQIKEGSLTTVTKKGGEAVRKSTVPFSEAQVRAELPKRIEAERPGATNYKKNFDFLAFLNSLGADVV